MIGRPTNRMDREVNFTSYLLNTMKNGNEYVSLNIDVPSRTGLCM